MINEDRDNRDQIDRDIEELHLMMERCKKLNLILFLIIAGMMIGVLVSLMSI
jgi:hypothetical protein